MKFINPKAATIKIPRAPLAQVDENHILDITLACACSGIPDPLNSSEREVFEHYIATNSEVSQKEKDLLKKLTEEERKQLFSFHDWSSKT